MFLSDNIFEKTIVCSCSEIIANTPYYSEILVIKSILSENLQLYNVIPSYCLLFYLSIDFIKIKGKFIDVRLDKKRFEISIFNILKKKSIVAYLTSSTEKRHDFEGCNILNCFIKYPVN